MDTRAHQALRRAVLDALAALGQGFLIHPHNGVLRAALADNSITAPDYFQALLSLAYRLMVLLTMEERGLLHPEGTPDDVRMRYADGYAVTRLGEKGRADLWESTGVVLRGLCVGDPRLGLPALGGIFAPKPCPAFDIAKLEDRAFFDAVSGLRGDGVSRVSWRDMEPEALGSVYESLLELVPKLDEGSFSFEETGGNARRTTGSYYTPDRLVQALLDAALVPVIQATIAANPGNEAAALLSLAIVDPACGSGHFLLAAARCLAGCVAGLEGGPSYREALREVVRRCIYGVDLNPMAVELCRVALWMEPAEPGVPLTFLDAHIRLGNALLGATPSLQAGGIPDSAWGALAGDDVQTARALKKRNKTESAVPYDAAPAPDRAALAADAWCAAFVWPKLPGQSAEAAPTTQVWRNLRDGGPVPTFTLTMVERLREEHQFFHWHLAFPDVYARGGFDVVLGNPPYLNQLEIDTAVGQGVRRLLGHTFGDVKQPYTDVATLFMVVAQGVLRPNGRQALVHPLALFAAKDAGPARRALSLGSTITSLWMTTEFIFPSAAVLVCAVCLGKTGSRNARIRRTYSNAFLDAEPIPVDMDQLADEPTWGALIADLIGVPRVRLTNPRRIRDIAGTTADFRDQFYGLIPFIVEDEPGRTNDREYPPLVITGLIDPAVCVWGARSCTFGKQKWARPRVDLARLDGALAAWARGRLTPKIVVATQSRVVEAFADPEGRVINTVPTITVTPHRVEDLWRLLAVLLSPPVSAWALGRYAGTALTISAIKMSAEQVGQVPLPTEVVAWEQAAGFVEHASKADNAAARAAALSTAGALMCDAYEVAREPVLWWWRERCGSTEAGPQAPPGSRSGPVRSPR